MLRGYFSTSSRSRSSTPFESNDWKSEYKEIDTWNNIYQIYNGDDGSDTAGFDTDRTRGGVKLHANGWIDVYSDHDQKWHQAKIIHLRKTKQTIKCEYADGNVIYTMDIDYGNHIHNIREYKTMTVKNYGFNRDTSLHEDWL